MDTTATEITEHSAAELANSVGAESALNAQAMIATKGAKWRKPYEVSGDPNDGRGGRTFSSMENAQRAFKAADSLRSTISDTLADPKGTVLKGISPSFAAERPDLMMALTELINNADVYKGITTTSPLSSGLVPFNLAAPSRLIYWMQTILRDMIPRVASKGTSFRDKSLTGISGTGTPTGSNGDLDFFLAEPSTFSSWPGTLPGEGSETAVDLNIPHKFMGITQSLTELARWAGEGFEDIVALTALLLMQKMMLAEEAAIIAGASTVCPSPATVTVTQRTANSGETAVTNVTNGQNAYVRVTRTNRYGETTSTLGTLTSFSTGNVIDVTITPGTADGGEQFNIYIGSGTADPGVGSTFKVASNVGGTKYTIQGAAPTAGSTPPTADTGTGSSLRFHGMLSVASGQAAADTGSGYDSTFVGGYVNNAVQNLLSVSVVNTALEGLYEPFKASPEQLIVAAKDGKNLSDDVAKNLSGTNFQLRITQDEVAKVTGGVAVSHIVNPVTRDIVEILVHPKFAQGRALLNSMSTPQAARNASVWAMAMVQDLLQIPLPVIDLTRRFLGLQYGTLVCYAPQYVGVLGGLQATTVSGSTGTWS